MRAEESFVKWFCRYIPKDWRVTRLETSTANGIPDTLVEIPQYGDILIEFKASAPYLRKEQYAWLTKRWNMGLQAAIICKQKNTVSIWNDRVKVKPLTSGKLRITSPAIEFISTRDQNPIEGIIQCLKETINKTKDLTTQV
jgi:hypothetical protein